MKWKELLNPIKDGMPGIRTSLDTLDYPQDDRSLFKKDFDTICNSSCIRRLQDKAQVFPLEKGDYARTRLTHSIETMSIAESLGLKAISIIQRMEGDSIQSDTLALISDIPTILKSAALLHDVGNPPFGHIGEDVISKWYEDNLHKLVLRYDKTSNSNRLFFTEASLTKQCMAETLTKEQVEDLLRFDGNAQVLRVATHLQNSIKNKGMNLTYPLLATLIKYPDNYLKQKSLSIQRKKRGYFLTEKEEYDKLQRSLCLGGNSHPLTFLLEASDDISYLVSDIEDAYKKRLISLQDIKNAINRVATGSVKEEIAPLCQKIETIEKYARRAKTGDKDAALIQQIRVNLKGFLLSKAGEAFECNYNSIMAGTYTEELLSNLGTNNLCKSLKELLTDKVYYCPEIVKTKIEATIILEKLLEAFVMAVFNVCEEGKHDDRDTLIYNLMSKNYCAVCNHAINGFKERNNKTLNLTKDEKDKRYRAAFAYNKLVLARDQLSGMTDTFATMTYQTIEALSI